jgi:hypothetical protein
VQGDGRRNQARAGPDRHGTGRGANRLASLTRGHRREVPELLGLLQAIHPRCWQVRGCPHPGHGAVTLPRGGPKKT